MADLRLSLAQAFLPGDWFYLTAPWENIVGKTHV
jgi:hypothetical protein